MKRENENGKRIGIWIRVSTEDQVRGESPEHHERRARLYAEAKGWTVVEVYRLDALSGKTVKDYPETKRMLEDIKTGHIEGIIFSKLARLARNTKELLDFAEYFREYDADLISLAESIDTSTPAGRLFYTMIAAMAQWEREEIAERVALSVPIRARLGKPLGGAAPYGYQWKDHALIPDEREAPIRKLLHELFLEHRRKKTVARLLNEKGYRTRNGSLFSDTTIERLLRDPTAKGIRRANYTETQNSKKAWRLKPEKEWVFHEVEAILPEALFDECVAILDAQKGAGKRPAKKAVHLFSGLTYCSCGTKMYVPSNSPKYVCKRCRNKIPQDDLEAIFHEQLKSFFFSKEEIMKYLEQSDRTMRDKTALLVSLEAERTKLKKEIDRLYDLYQSGDIDKGGFGRKYGPLAERERQLEDGIPSLQAELDVMRISVLSREDIIADIRDLYSHWPELPQDEKRRIIEAITERIVIFEDEVEVSLFYDPPAPSQGSGGGTPPAPSSPQDRGGMATKPHGRVAFLPWVRVTLKALKPKEYPENPQTLGEHLKRARLQRKLSQQAAAHFLGVDPTSVLHWEKGRTEPPMKSMPAILAFLGYDPYPEPVTLQEMMRAKRRERGWTIKEAAEQLGVDESTWGEWERCGVVRWERYRTLLSGFLASDRGTPQLQEEERAV